MDIDTNGVGNVFEGRGTQMTFHLRRNGYLNKKVNGLDHVFVKKDLLKKEEL